MLNPNPFVSGVTVAGRGGGREVGTVCQAKDFSAEEPLGLD